MGRYLRCRYLRVACPSNLIPAPGQYLLASDDSDSPLPVPLFYTDSVPQGFTAAAPLVSNWTPGLELYLRGPVGRGFNLPLEARKVGLVAFDYTPARLRGLIRPALEQDAAVVLLCDSAADNLPDDVEVQPLSMLNEIAGWADYIAFDVARENLNLLRERLRKPNQWSVGKKTEIMIRTQIPCGGIADCGICAVTLKADWKLACKDGPVFDWMEV
jgi:NAD(P)H-flavin reductase